MKELILIGGGGHCKSCIEVIESVNKYRIKGILDTIDKKGEKVLNYEVIGEDYDIIKFKNDFYFLITIGFIKHPNKRLQVLDLLKKLKVNLVTIISPYSIISPYAKIGEGSILMHHSIVNAGAAIGDNCIINTKALVEHDSIVDDNVHISTGAILNGKVQVGSNSFIGSGAVIVQNTIIPANSYIKANSLIY